MYARAEEPGALASGLLAFAVHAIFFGLLVIGISWQKKPVAPPSVELWRDQQEPLPERLALPPPAPELKHPTRPPEIKRAAPLPPPPKPVPTIDAKAEIELKEARARKLEEIEEKRRIAEAKKQEQLEQKRAEKEKLELQRKLHDEQEQARKEAEERKLAEARAQQTEELQQKQRLDEERKRSAAVEAERQARIAQVQREQRERQEARTRAEVQQKTQQQKTVDEFMVRIQAKIRAHIVIPPSMTGNPEAIYEVALFANGTLNKATLARSSGVTAYDEAVLRAMHAAEPLPLPADPELFQQAFRELRLAFRPNE
jgi:colicin import membrane protein